MSAVEISDTEARIAMRSYIQRVATGPEYSKDLSYDEAHQGMRLILEDRADPIQAAVFFIGLRMKRETDEENRGVLQAILEETDRVTAEVDELLDIADPYDGYTRGVPASPFLAPVLAACGVPSVSHGLDTVGPKYGVTHHKVLRALGIDVGLSTRAAAEQVANPDVGWAYVDQSRFCAPLHNLVPLRQRIVKRPIITTVEVLAKPLCGRHKTHLLTGYVHKAYPPIYTSLARHAGFDSAMIVRGVEGGVIPSLQQPAKLFSYTGQGADEQVVLEPTRIGLNARSRAVPLPQDLPPAPAGDEIAATIDSEAVAERAAQMGLAALKGEKGLSYDSLVYGAAICLSHLGRSPSLAEAADQVRGVLDSGAAAARLEALR